MVVDWLLADMRHFDTGQQYGTIPGSGPDTRSREFHYTDRDGEVVEVTQTCRYEPDTQIARTVHYKGDTDEVVGGLSLRMYFPQELDALLRYNGFQVVAKYGDWDLAAFGPGSRHQLCVCGVEQSAG